MRPALGLTVALAACCAALAQYGDISELKVARKEDKEHVKTTPPPKGAKVLFDGKSLDGWLNRKDGKAASWKLVDGAMQVAAGTDIHTKEKFDGTFKLHVEFRVPYEPKNKGQGRGNSGVYVQGRYEVQVLDSYGVKSPGMGDCGAIYGVAVAKTNECKAPTVWQSYDIEFTAPSFEGKKQTAAAVMTVWHNGVKIHDKVALKAKNKDGKEEYVTNTTSGMGGDASQPGPIMLQDHGHPVQYRNIWLQAKK